MSLPSDVTINNLSDFYQAILPYLNVGNGGTSDTPLGQVAFFDDLVAPAGWLIADGTVYNISDYPDLANRCERVHGSKNFYGGNGTTTFAVPDLQGEFLRASGTNSHTNQGSGAAVGVHQDATEQLNVVASGNGIYVAKDGTETTNMDSKIGEGKNYVGITGSSGTSSNYYRYTPRPTNTSLLCCVKAVPSSEMNTYSTTERRVGTWIDGKPIYQKTYKNVNTGNGDTNIIDISIKKDGNITTSSNNASMSLFIRTNISNKDYIALTISNNDWCNRYGNVTIQYTKTTD